MILRILLPLLLFLLLPAWGIDRLCLYRKVRNLWRVLFYLPNAILALGFVLLAVNESYTAQADYWKGTLLTATLAVVVPETLLVLFLSTTFWIKKWCPKTGKVVSSVGWAAAFLFFLAMVYGMTLGYRRIVVKEVRFESSSLPVSFRGYRIVQLSDLHLGTLHGRGRVVQDIVDSVNACAPDLVVFTGDLVNYRADEVREFVPVLRQFKAKDGVVAVMGNHDYAQYFRWNTPEDSMADIRKLQDYERQMGWRLLLNDNYVIRRGGDSIAIVGVENEGRPPFPALADMEKAQRGLADGCFRILLSHDPSHWRREVLGETTIPVTLSGHTHGMQFKIGSFSPAVWFYPEWGGAYYSGKERMLHVSLGTGEVLMPFRLGAWPEVTLLTLEGPSAEG